MQGGGKSRSLIKGHLQAIASSTAPPFLVWQQRNAHVCVASVFVNFHKNLVPFFLFAGCRRP
jgi:hypothetical protein